MANSQAMCTDFKVQLMNGHHAIGTCTETRTASTKDTIKGALYLNTGSLGAATTAYSSTNELAATGNYTAGGATVTNATAPTSSGTTAYWTPSASLQWTTFTSSGTFDAVLLYNDTFTTKRAISVHTFGNQAVTAGTFTLTMPTNDASTGLIRFA